MPLTTTSFSLSNLGDAGHTLTILRHTHLIFVSRKSSVDIQISSTAAINRGFLQIIVHSLLQQVRFILEFVRQIIDVEYYITPDSKQATISTLCPSGDLLQTSVGQYLHHDTTPTFPAIKQTTNQFLLIKITANIDIIVLLTELS